MSGRADIRQAVGRLYEKIDEEVRGWRKECEMCGKCCDFAGYDHRLYVTGVELVYFAEKLGAGNLRRMSGGKCPYLEGGRCLVHEQRFAGCRIFNCQGEGHKQSELSERVVAELKRITEAFGVEYCYVELGAGLEELAGRSGPA